VRLAELALAGGVVAGQTSQLCALDVEERLVALRARHLEPGVGLGERGLDVTRRLEAVGSMELAEQVDPEEWHNILDRFFTILTDGVHRFEGTVNQYTGDGIMALFGAPIAHEDHAQRACYAVLFLRDAVREYANEVRVRHGIPFGVRIGLNVSRNATGFEPGHDVGKSTISAEPPPRTSRGSGSRS
jgi:class 3 adenylate cyclase